MEVIYTGLRQSPEAIARAAVQEDVDAVGLSVLSGAHMPLAEKVLAELRAAKAGDVPVLVGGNVPKRDHEKLLEMGVAAVFATGAPFDGIVEFLKSKVER